MKAKQPVAKAAEDILRLANASGRGGEKFGSTMQKAATGDCSPRSAIRAKCVECCGFEDAVNRVRECAAYKCPLHAFRPYQLK